MTGRGQGVHVVQLDRSVRADIQLSKYLTLQTNLKTAPDQFLFNFPFLFRLIIPVYNPI